jgi:hypothetical protein
MTLKKQYLWPIIILIVLVGLYIQIQAPLNHDIGWVLFGSKAILHGAEFGKDIIEPNPPLIWFIMIPVAYLAEITDFNIALIFNVTVTLSAMLSLAFTHKILANNALKEYKKGFLPIFLIFLTLMWMPLANRDFGQREYLSLIAVIPLAFCIQIRLVNSIIHPVTAYLLGAIAGAGLALKPYLMIIPVCFVLVGIKKQGRQIFQWYELYGLTSFIISYLISIFIFTPEYINTVIPLVQKLYWGFNNPPLIILHDTCLQLIAFIFWLLLKMINRTKLSSLEIVFFILFMGYAFNLIIQLKGYTYHIYPVTVTLSLLILTSIYSLHQDNDVKIRYSRIFWLLIFILTLNKFHISLIWSLAAMNPKSSFQSDHKIISDEINRLAANGKFTVFGTHPFPGFPIALNVNARWVGRSNSHFAIPAIVKSLEKGHSADKDVLDYANNEVLYTIGNLKPDLVLVDQRPLRHAIFNSKFDFISFYIQNKDFGNLWQNYRRASKIGDIIFYKFYPQTKIRN